MFKNFIIALLLSVSFFVSSNSVFAVSPDELLDDPVQEQRARDISSGLRCIVCQNQSIDDSKAPLAKDLRILVRDRIKAGDSNSEVMSFIVARYGDFVLLKPPFNKGTIILWLAPLLLLLAGLMMIKRFNSQARIDLAKEEKESSVAKAKLSTDEQAQLKKLLED